MIKTEIIEIESGETVTMSVEKCTESELKAVKGQLENIKTEITHFKCHECKHLIDDKNNFSHINTKTANIQWIQKIWSEFNYKGCEWVLDNKYNRDTHDKNCSGPKYHQCGTCYQKFLKSSDTEKSYDQMTTINRKYCNLWILFKIIFKWNKLGQTF